jgi:regulator of sirC expression with transglutaminase-like and TPR domain
MLSNLKSLYLMQTDLEHALAAIERILLLNPQAVMELRDRGLIYYQFGRWQEARLDLETYLQAIPASSEETADLAVIRQLLQRMQPPDH